MHILAYMHAYITAISTLLSKTLFFAMFDCFAIQVMDSVLTMNLPV